MSCRRSATPSTLAIWSFGRVDERRFYTGLFAAPFLDIPPTRHMVHMRFHEFFRFEEGRVVEIQALWDLPEVMMQAGAWPMAPSLGREWHVPGPATQDELDGGPRTSSLVG